jgi:hypothetical protein
MFPIYMVTWGPGETLKLLAKGKHYLFRIQDYAKNDFDYATGAHQETDSDHHIWCAWTNFKTSKRALEVHDGAMEVFKNITLFTAGLVGAGVTDAVAGPPPLPGSYAERVANICGGIKDAVGTIPDIVEIQEQLRGQGKSKGGGIVALLIAPFPLNDGASTGKSSVTAPELGDVAAKLLLSKHH